MRRISFRPIAWLAASLVITSIVAVPASASPGTTERLSVDSGELQQNGNSLFTSVSADGRFVAFASGATNLVSGDTNGFYDIFVRDRMLGTTIRASVASDGSQSNGQTDLSVISADGRYLAFESDASNLVVGDTNNATDVFIHNLITGQTTRVSVLSDGGQRSRRSYNVDVSDDGRYVTFGASHESDDDPAGVYVYDTLLGLLSNVGRYSDGTIDEYSQTPAISGDGRFVVFNSGQPLVPGDTNNQQDIFVRDLLLNATTRVTLGVGGAETNGPSEKPEISGDGRYVAFQSYAANLVAGDTNGSYDMFVVDRQLGTTTRASVSSSGGQANANSTAGFRPSLSVHGRFFAFESSASNLVAGDTNASGDVFVHDLQTGDTTRESVSSGGVQGNSDSSSPALSSNGSYLVFRSSATNLVAGDTNGSSDIFGREGSEVDVPTDATPPTVTGTPDRAANGNGWYKAAVTIDWQATDDSGQASDPPNTNAATEGTVTYTSDPSCDPSNNCATGELELSIDLSDPTVTCAAASFAVNQPGASVSASVADSVSGPVATSVSAPANTSTAGTFSVNLTGEDLAGRTKVKSCSYTVGYVFTGFFQPIDNLPTVNKANAGQTIPVKWRITDYNGVGISTPASFVSITSGSTSCSPSDPIDVLETYSGSSGLQYQGNGNWQFNWSTPKSYAGQCRVMRLNLADGNTSRIAEFQFK